MIDSPIHLHAEAPLNTYSVAQLNFALDQDNKSAINALNFDVHVLSGTASPALLTPQSSDADFDYSSRRMSSSAASDSSSSRPDKRPFDYSPSASPTPKKSRHDDNDWSPQPNNPHQLHDSLDSRSATDYTNPNSPRIQLPSINSSFLDGRRASLPSSLASDALTRPILHLPHPSLHRPSQSTTSLGTYTFPGPDGSSQIKSENDWSFPPPATEYSMSPPSSTVNTLSVSPSSARSPQQSPASVNNNSSLVERPPRKRGKLPKPVTDFLKDWLHRHSDHPYPSEEEKKALCHATGLSMSQVSNWMINARRRILAPAHRAAQGPTTNGPYATPLGGHPRPILDAGRRASMPADTLALHYPMSLQSIPDYTTSPSTRHLVGMSRSMSSGHASVGSLSATAHHGHHSHHGHHPYGGIDTYSRQSLYGSTANSNNSSAALHPSSHVGGGGGGGGGYLGVPMSAPASMSTGGAGQHYSNSHGYSNSNSYGRVSPDGHHHHQHHSTSQARYSFPSEHSVSPGPGSGYNTPH
ncbi:hypothetical protein BC835DRAFT_1418642 [Cytidiella melzeri]|nr:hypothetical protein BC835DRAFT_1418642 [Cytidiella melzeri]